MSVCVAMWCVIPAAAACSAPLSNQRPADASTTAHPECLRVQVCLHACLQHRQCSSEHAAMPTAEPCLHASIAAPSCCRRAVPSGHSFAAGETCMTRQARPVINKRNFLCDVLSGGNAVVPRMHDRRQFHQRTADVLFSQRVVAGNEVTDTPHMTIFLG